MSLRISSRIQHALRWRLLGSATPEGSAGVTTVGHREYVGGMWEEIGQLQFEYLVSQGLRPEHVLLDIACGSLRGGVHFIDYLEVGHYLGIEKEQALVQRGLAKELAADVQATKQPEFVISDKFEFARFSKRPDFSLAQSLFTHLTEHDIRLCLRNLRVFASNGHSFYATFFAGEDSSNKQRSHAHASFRYEPAQLAEMGEQEGWQANYIGDWGHPRGQVMMEFSLA